MARKDFNKGMEAGAKPFEEKFKKQEQAFKNSTSEINRKIDGINDVTDEIIKDLNSIEKKRLYDLNTIVDISELGNDEKELLIAVLYTLADMTDYVTAYQQLFLRSVKKYLKAKTVQTLTSLSVIENVENINDQKAILQTVMEFLFLENANHDYLDEYEDIFDYFSVNKKGIRELQGAIDTIYNATGLQGIAEKYGYEAEGTKNSKDHDEDDFPEYDGSDILEKCADAVNAHDDYIILDKYLVYTNAYDGEYFRVDKKTGESVKFKLPIWGISYIGMSACDGKSFFVYCHTNVKENGKHILVDVETFKFIEIDVIGKCFNGGQSNSKKMYYITSTEEGCDRLIEYDVAAKQSKVLNNSINGENNFTCSKFILINNKIYFYPSSGHIVNLYPVSDENALKDKLYCYDIDTLKINDVCEIPGEAYYFLTLNATYKYKNFIYTVYNDFDEKVSFAYLDLKNPVAIKVGKVPEYNVKFLCSFGGWIYYVRMNYTNAVGRYNIITGENTCIMDRTGILFSYEEGFLKKHTVYSIVGVKAKVVGGWLYYEGQSTHKIRKISVQAVNGESTIL